MRILVLSFLTPILFVDLDARTPDAKQSTSSQLASHAPVSEDPPERLRQSPLDAIGIDSALWRSEYLPPPNDQSGKNTEDAGEAQTGSGGEKTEQESPRTGNAVDATLVRLMDSSSVEFAALSVPSVTDSFDLCSDADGGRLLPETLSDWDSAASVATQKKILGSTVSGPTATSAIVGFAGIVIGAYVSSGNRRGCE